MGTMALYVRIPEELHRRLHERANEGDSWRRRGGLQRVVIGALVAFLEPPKGGVIVTKTKKAAKGKRGGK
jgi:hypothetical protein